MVTRLVSTESDTVDFERLSQLPIPQAFFNSFGQGVTLTDVNSVLLYNQKPVLLLSMSLSVAKSFAEATLDSIASYERDLNIKVLSLDELSALATGIDQARKVEP